MPWLLVLAFLFLFLQPGLIVRSAGADPMFGYQTVGSKNEPAGYLFCTRASLPQTAPVTSISFYSGLSGNVKVGIYADSNGPSNVVIGPVETVGSTAGAWNTVTVTPTSLTAGTYWICGQTNTAGALKYDSVGTGRYVILAYGAAWPGPGAGWVSAAVSVSVYASYNTGPDFYITASPTSQSVSAGSTASYTLSLTADSGYGGTVTVTLSSSTPCPTGATCTFNGSPSTSVNSFPASVTFAVATQTSGFTGTTSLTASASDGTYTHTTGVSLTVTPYVGPDFSINASPTSQSVAAGSTASYTLNLAASGEFSDTVSLSVTSGCPTGVTCTVTPTSVSSYPSTATLSVPTLLTTPGGTISVVVTATGGGKTHTTSVGLTISGPASFGFNVRPGATQVVVTLTYSWTGSGPPPAGSITIAGPGGTPMLMESGAVIYDRTSIAASGSSSAYILLHRVTFTITAPSSTQTWTVLVSLPGVSNYNVTIEVS